MEPQSVNSLILPVSLFPDADIVGSMDRGCSLTKFLYKKQIPNDSSKISLEMSFFLNKDFDAGLQWLRKKLRAEACAGTKFRVSGVGGEKFKEQVAAATGLELEFIDEFVSHTLGAQLLVKNLQDDDFCYPDLAPQPTGDMPEVPDWIQKLINQVADHYKENIGKRFPAMFAFCGSASGFNVLNEDKKLEMLGPLMFGGRSLLGISNLLLGTNSYDELMELAGKGDKANVDTVAAEVMALGDNAEFRGLPPDTSLFPFGKAADAGADAAKDFTKEDLAASLISLIVSSMMPLIMSYCKDRRIPNVYFGGHLFRSPAIRNAFHSIQRLNMSNMGVFKFRFLSNGHTGCIGAMLVAPQEAQAMRMAIKY